MNEELKEGDRVSVILKHANGQTEVRQNYGVVKSSHMSYCIEDNSGMIRYIHSDRVIKHTIISHEQEPDEPQA